MLKTLSTNVAGALRTIVNFNCEAIKGIVNELRSGSHIDEMGQRVLQNCFMALAIVGTQAVNVRDYREFLNDLLDENLSILHSQNEKVLLHVNIFYGYTLDRLFMFDDAPTEEQ